MDEMQSRGNVMRIEISSFCGLGHGEVSAKTMPPGPEIRQCRTSRSSMRRGYGGENNGASRFGSRQSSAAARPESRHPGRASRQLNMSFGGDS
jgi:hypothetical protein